MTSRARRPNAPPSRPRSSASPPTWPRRGSPTNAAPWSSSSRRRPHADAEQARERAERELQDGERRRADELADSRRRAEAAEEVAARARDDLEQATQRVLALERQLGSGPPAIADSAGSAIATGDAAAALSDNGHVVPGLEHGLDPSSPEFEPRRAFLSQYLGTVRWTQRPVDGVDPLALPQAADRRHVLVDRADQVLVSPSIDVVVCVHNALEDVRVCLWSLVAKSDRPFRLIVVNDGSDAATTAYLESVAATNPKVTLIHNAEPPHGYTIAANLGMREATADYVVVLNSDTIVTFGWLQRLVDSGESNDGIGILGPLSNAASHQSVPRLREGGSWATNPLPPWLTAGRDGVDRGARLAVRPAAPAVHQRLLLRRQARRLRRNRLLRRGALRLRLLRGERLQLPRTEGGLRARGRRRRLRLPRQVEVVHGRGAQRPRQAQLPDLPRQARARGDRDARQGDGGRHRPRAAAGRGGGRGGDAGRHGGGADARRHRPAGRRLRASGPRRRRLGRLALDLPGGARAAPARGQRPHRAARAGLHPRPGRLRRRGGGLPDVPRRGRPDRQDGRRRRHLGDPLQVGGHGPARARGPGRLPARVLHPGLRAVLRVEGPGGRRGGGRVLHGDRGHAPVRQDALAVQRRRRGARPVRRQGRAEHRRAALRAADAPPRPRRPGPRRRHGPAAHAAPPAVRHGQGARAPAGAPSRTRSR